FLSFPFLSFPSHSHSLLHKIHSFPRQIIIHSFQSSSPFFLPFSPRVNTHTPPILPPFPLTREGMALDMRVQRGLERDLRRTHPSLHSTSAVILPPPLVTHSTQHSLPSFISPDSSFHNFHSNLHIGLILLVYSPLHKSLIGSRIRRSCT